MSAGVRVEGSADEPYVEVDWLHDAPVLAAWAADRGWAIDASPHVLHRVGYHGGLDWDLLLARPLPADWPLGFAGYERGTHLLTNGGGYLLEADGTVRPGGSLGGGPVPADPLDVDSLDRVLRKPLRALRGRRVGLLLSGGLDSALLAALLAAESVQFDAACVADRDNAQDVESARALCAELGASLSVVEPGPADYVAALPVATSAFADPRPDVFRALGLVFGARALAATGCDVIVGGEPADDVLRSSRVFFDARGAGRRAYLWRECLRDTIPRSVHLLGRAAALVAADAAAPYADPALIAAAVATDWSQLQDPSRVTTGSGGGLGGPGFKPLQKAVARRLGCAALDRICDRGKLGLPHASQSHWLALKALLGGADDGETFTRLWRLSGALYEATVCAGQPPETVPMDRTIEVARRPRAAAGDLEAAR